MKCYADPTLHFGLGIPNKLSMAALTVEAETTTILPGTPQEEEEFYMLWLDNKPNHVCQGLK